MATYCGDKKHKVKNPGGTGVSPVHSFQRTRRNLPHMQEPGRVYFLTWRCRPGIMLSTPERTIVFEALQYWDGVKWKIFTAVVLPDHIHALVQPLPHPGGGMYHLAEILHSIKSVTSHKISDLRGMKGSLWQDESYDRIVRDEGEFLGKWNYIRNNPVKAGLADSPENYAWFYERGA
jgi:putative transposase